MMDVALNAWLLLDHAPRHFGDTQVVSQVAPGELHRYTYADMNRRTHQLMHALDRMGLDRGARVATLAWNGHRHLECYFAIPCTGRVIHTVNARLSPEEVGYLLGHARDEVVFVDPDLLPLLEQVGPSVDSLRRVVVLGDSVPDTGLAGVVAYEDLIADEAHEHDRVDVPEGTPLGLCYTSGTTGRPKGALYTHRSTYLHALTVTSGAGFGIGPQECVLPVVPMFHANAWGMPYASTLVGAKQVFAGRHLDPPLLVDLLEGERVTTTGGVPTVWLGVADELVRRGTRLPHLRQIVCGGAQPPRALIERYRTELGLSMIQAWGMTESSPLASMALPKAHMAEWSDEELTDVVRTQAGLPVPGISLTIRDDDGNDVPWDGKTMGQLLMRGPAVIDGYLGGEGAEAFTADGWFQTGDVAIGSPHGYMVIADRTKDLIKSGGEWISSVDMEAALMAIPAVREAAVIAVPDPRWLERPLACVVLRAGSDLDVEAARDHLEAAGFARWQLPDRFEVIDEVPRTSVGKFDKKALRARFEA